MKTFSELVTELTVGVRDKKTSAEKMAAKREYKKNRVKILQRNKKYKKSARAKMLDKKSKMMAKKGKTATGRDVSVAGGAGAQQRAKEKKAELRR
tara:strand:- start:511 stop:795 length:285 start_codon:yes stop_codon:yes gene_type:complete